MKGVALLICGNTNCVAAVKRAQKAGPQVVLIELPKQRTAAS